MTATPSTVSELLALSSEADFSQRLSALLTDPNHPIGIPDLLAATFNLIEILEGSHKQVVKEAKNGELKITEATLQIWKRDLKTLKKVRKRLQTIV